ncbi:MAG TPA: 7-cyano-7-deazaguanine synthase QueC [Thermoplasmata archaeon]|nr:7-cyano-7-deazaguanine synthase QueC [Thermoplasmata archaeon]
MKPRGNVVLLSGGMDSATTLALARRAGGPVHALTVSYGQRHLREIRAARRIARWAAVDAHVTVALPIGPLLPSALTDRRRRISARPPRVGAIPATYVPARNTILLALALGYAEPRGLERIWIGANAIDYSGYPDCRPAFLRAFEALARRATRAGVEGRARFTVEAPLLRRSKAEIVRLGDRLHVPWALTWSCYRGGKRPCGACDACRLRARGFREARRDDPALRLGGRRKRRGAERAPARFQRDLR